MKLSAVVSDVSNSLKNYFQATGLVAYAGSQLFILVVLLKSGGFRAAGDFALSQAIIAPIFGFAAFSLRPYWVSGVIRNLDMYQFFQLRIISILGGSGIIFIAKQVFFPSADGAIFFMVFALKAHELISDIFYAALDVAGRSATAGKLLMGKAFAIGICGGSCFVIGASITAFQYAIYFTIVFVLILELRVVAFNVSSLVNALVVKRTRLISLFRLISWASASSVVASVTGFLPRYFLEELHGREAVGYYSTAAALGTVVLMICTGLAQTELGRFSAAYSRGDWPQFSGILRRNTFLLAGLMLVAACSAAGSTIALELWNQNFLAPKIGYEISVLLILFFPLYLAQLLSYAVMPLARIRETFILALVSLLLQAAVSSTFIRWHELYGAVAASVIGGFVQSVGFSFLLYRYFYLRRLPG